MAEERRKRAVGENSVDMSFIPFFIITFFALIYIYIYIANDSLVGLLCKQLHLGAIFFTSPLQYKKQFLTYAWSFSGGAVFLRKHLALLQK
jgi:hypothetical protein